VKRKSQPTVTPVQFIDRVIKLDEKGEPFTLAPYQRRVLEMALRRDPSWELAYRIVLLSEPKNQVKRSSLPALCFGGLLLMRIRKSSSQPTTWSNP
jgi:hypothetical protein